MYSGIEGNEFTLQSGDNVQTWGTDDQGWNLNCSFTEQGWSLTQNQEFDMVVTRGESTTAQMECGLVISTASQQMRQEHGQLEFHSA